MPSCRGRHFPIDRRTFLVAGGLSYFGLNLVSSSEAPPAGRRRVARSTIMIWLSGGASHIDTWDMKPKAPLEYRGPFRQMPTAVPGVDLC